MAKQVEAELILSAKDRTARAFGSMEKRLRTASRLADQFNRKQAQMARAQRLQQQMARADRTVMLGGRAMLGGLAAAGGIHGGLTTLSSYQDALIEIAKKGGLAKDQMKAIGDEAKALATSGELAVPLDEILSSYERAAAAGLPIEEWKEFARLSAMAADAFAMSAEEVGNAAAGFKVGLGIPMAEMERYFDLINSLADSGISDEKDIIKFLDNAGAGLKNFGLSAKEAAAYGATLLNLKLGPETGARMMNALTSKLLAPENLGKKGYQALGQVVGDLKAFKKEMKSDPQGALRKFLAQLGKLDKFKRARLTGAIFGSEWSDEIMRLVDGVEELDRNLDLARSKDWFGSLGKSYQMKLEALSSRWQLFKNQVSELAIDLGELSMPGLEAGLERARSLIKEINTEVGAFGSKLDADAIEGASESIDRLLVSIENLLKVDGKGSHVEQFFADMARVTNDVAVAIAAIERGAKFLMNPTGLEQPTGGSDGTAKKSDTYSILGGSITFDKEWVDAIGGGIEDLHNWMNWWSTEIRAAASGAPPPPIPGTSAPAAGSGYLTPPADIAVPPEPPMKAGTSPSGPTGADTPILMQFDPGAADLLRDAMEAGGGEVRSAGVESADAIREAAQELRAAADRIGENGRAAAAAISAARPQMPVPSPTRAGSSGPNANLGQSMPNAGITGQ